MVMMMMCKQYIESRVYRVVELSSDTTYAPSTSHDPQSGSRHFLPNAKPRFTAPRTHLRARHRTVLHPHPPRLP